MFLHKKKSYPDYTMYLLFNNKTIGIGTHRLVAYLGFSREEISHFNRHSIDTRYIHFILYMLYIVPNLVSGGKGGGVTITQDTPLVGTRYNTM